MHPEPAQPAQQPGRPTRRRSRDAIDLRNLLPLEVALAVGFFLGVLEALDRLDHPMTVTILIGGVAATAAVGFFSSLGRSRPTERLLAALLRIGLGAALFALFYEGMRLFMRIGKVGLALACWTGALVLVLLLAKLATVAAPTDAQRRPPR